jgi:Xaa-Pro aminopeptidase
MDYKRRINALREALTDIGAASAVIARRDAIRYLCGFAGSFGDLIIDESRALLVTDGRYATAAKNKTSGVEPIIGGQGLELVPEVLKERGIAGPIAFDSDAVTVARLHGWQRALPGVDLLPAPGIVDPIMAVKDEGEIEAMAEACRITDRVWERIQSELVPGATEMRLAQRLAELQLEAGAVAHGFAIVASGPNSAYPHHAPTSRRLREGDLVKVDFGCMYDGYNSDLTRTVVLGEATDEQRRIYEAVYRAQVAGCAAVRDGVTGDEVDRAARSVIEEAGYGEYFTHGLGHGLGIAKHPPHVRPGYDLVAGNAITIEPGIYIEGLGGVRIEDLGIVTGTGYRVLSHAPKPPSLCRPGEWQ